MLRAAGCWWTWLALRFSHQVELKEVQSARERKLIITLHRRSALQPLIDVLQAIKAFRSQDYKAKAPLPKEEVEDALPRASPLFCHLTHLAFFHVSTLAKVSKKEADDGKSL